MTFAASPMASPMKSSPARTPMMSTPQHQKPCCTALYDFDAENPGELSFKVCKKYNSLS